MIEILVFITAAMIISQALVGLSFLVSSIWEREKRASLFAGLQLLGMLFPLFVFFYLLAQGFFRTPLGIYLLIVGIICAGTIFYFIARQSKSNPRALAGSKGLIVGQVNRFDERIHVFARNRSLKPGSEQYKQLYKEYPKLEDLDADRRQKGGPLGHPGIIDSPHGDANVAAFLASANIPLYLSTPEKIKPLPHPHLKAKKVEMLPEEATKRIKGYTRHLGAGLVGITELNPLWTYSRRGEIFHENWEDWGKEIAVDHKFAIVFTDEMTLDMIGTGPHTPTTLESMRDYAQGAHIAVQLAAFIANLGYSATANHLRHYECLMVPLAVDAGLGELGRLGYLITKEYGPRIRLGAVTTSMPLIPDKPVDIGVEDFCKICKKCAHCCPTRSISADDQTIVNGSLRWKLNAETCFEYWGKAGTDCNVCMRVCPWSHARTFPHRFIVALVSRNALARRLFSFMDDIFYGKYPKVKPLDNWTTYKPWKKT